MPRRRRKETDAILEAPKKAAPESGLYIVKPGDNRPKICKAVNLHPDTLTRLNPQIKDWWKMETGTKLNITP